jgi:hypothetical protein
MSYGNFETDAVKTARTLHLTYRRCEYLLARWYSGINNSQTWDDATTNLMSRVAELVDDYDANGSAKLNTVLAKSDLSLPGDE